MLAEGTPHGQDSEVDVRHVSEDREEPRQNACGRQPTLHVMITGYRDAQHVEDFQWPSG